MFTPEPEPTVSDAAPQTYDLVILGAGTGGYSAAFRAGLRYGGTELRDFVT